MYVTTNEPSHLNHSPILALTKVFILTSSTARASDALPGLEWGLQSHEQRYVRRLICRNSGAFFPTKNRGTIGNAMIATANRVFGIIGELD